MAALFARRTSRSAQKGYSGSSSGGSRAGSERFLPAPHRHSHPEILNNTPGRFRRPRSPSLTTTPLNRSKLQPGAPSHKELGSHASPECGEVIRAVKCSKQTASDGDGRQSGLRCDSTCHEFTRDPTTFVDAGNSGEFTRTTIPEPGRQVKTTRLLLSRAFSHAATRQEPGLHCQIADHPVATGIPPALGSVYRKRGLRGPFAPRSLRGRSSFRCSGRSRRLPKLRSGA